ncbi:MAG TPA: PolC-type DNA polymerase III [Candidatus Pullichristensenella excrementigallinarum]|uniref:DNA polymerase III PolC-type n=1 Tax=Candidatus Pullichristensenella excrementigallinarum TaxID=2840907 RepID=A0A9D1IAC3_9FIRM|nr:PolC-type DNA polymerase III [Candidatus Pullichristensenella excrementigallinarum]
MSELWRELVSKDSPDLSGLLSLRRVHISQKTGEMLIRLNASRLLTREEFKRISRALAAAFPAVGVRVRISYPDLREQAEADISQVAGFLIELVKHESPGSVPFLENGAADFRLENGALCVTATSEEGARYMRARHVDELLSRLLKELFDLEAPTRIETAGDEEARLRRIAQERAKEAERMAQQAREESAKCESHRGKVAAEAVYGRMISDPVTPMNEVTEDIGRMTVVGEVAAMEMREAKNGQSRIVTFSMSDHHGSVNCKLFLGGQRARDEGSVEQQAEKLQEALKDGMWVKARGAYRYDDYKREMMLIVNDINSVPKPVREDTAPEKRVELHLHTQMSTMDACASATDLIKQAAKWGHKAIAITDHGVVQAFPEAFGAAKKNNIKLIPGCEGYLIEDAPQIVENPDGRDLETCAFVVLDFETTGLNPSADEIIEIGAVRIENGEEVSEFSQLIRPGRAIPEKVVELTGITPAMLADQPTIREVLPAFWNFLQGAVLVAHNASFDLAFLRRACKRENLPLNAPVLDTLALARNQYPELRNHKLGTVCKHLNVSLKDAHRAVHDARATGLVLLRSLAELGAKKLRDINNAFHTDAGGKSHHIILLAKNQQGMANLYRLVSEGHLNYFHRTPRIPRKLIEKYRDGLIVGSACESGEMFRAVLAGKDARTLERIARFYDYLEIQPIGNNGFLVREGTVPDEKGLQDLNRKIVALGEKLGIPVVATGDVHFMNPEDGIFRAILMAYKGFENADEQPPLYFRTTDEMLEEFSYLGEETARRVVVEAPNRIADQIEDVHLFPPHPEGKETFQPFWPEAEHELREITLGRAREIYGDPLPEIVQKRIDKELGAIIGYGFSTLYMIAVKLVAKSLADGYIVGSRGSVGSSLVAYLSGITEVNSLPPHYVCPKCKHVDFDVEKLGKTGLDLPPMDCPKCGTPMHKDGFNIPFEVFLGFKGNKVPDIDLNFSGVYQPRAHNYIKELFGTKNVFRAGTIGTIAEKTAYGYVLRYMEERDLHFPNAEKERLARGITGVKRTTGQHPAGMVVLPKDYEIYQFTPIQHPADDMKSETITTHFDFSSMHDVLVKLDVLGHDDPTMLRKLQDLTGIAPREVPLNDAQVFRNILSLFSSPKALGLTAEELGVPTGTLGIPEFGTRFVRGMLVETMPSTMEELIRISGLSHGTDVWLGNTQDLVHAGVPLSQCICTRDDIMNALISFGVDSEVAFKTMESVRKGKGLQPFMEEAIQAVDAPDWYIDSCKKIKYMFPKAHAVAYVMMGLRIAYFKIYYPAAYYTCYLQRNLEDFDATRMVTADVTVYRAMIEGINALEKEERERKDGELSLLEILIEMNLRGIRILPVDLYKSDALEFALEEEGIRPPINALPGVGQQAAEAYVRAREEGPFISRDDMLRRKVARGTIEALRLAGCLNDIPETSQVTLFEFEV